MKTHISIELDQGETLEVAMQQLLGTKAQTRACSASKTEVAPAEKPAPKGVRKTAAASTTAHQEPKAADQGAGGTEAEPAAGPANAPSREDVRRAAMNAMNEGKRDGVEDILKAHGGTLKDVPEADLAAVLAKIEVL